MLRFILLKIKNKYKLYLCLLVGLIFMEASLSLIMMFRTGSLNKLIQKGFVTEYEETGKFPAVLSRVSAVDIEAAGCDIEDIIDEMNSYETSWHKYLDVPMIDKQHLLYMKGFKAEPSYRGSTMTFDIGYMDTLNEHIDIVDGQESDITENDIPGNNTPKSDIPGNDIPGNDTPGNDMPENTYPCYVSEYTADAYDLVVGEKLNFENLSVYISGIIREKRGDYYWNKGLYENGHMLYVDKTVIQNIMDNNVTELTAYEMYDIVDYRYVNASNVKGIKSILAQFHERDEMFDENISPVIVSYERESTSLMAVLYVIALPLVILVMIFILMMAVRIIDSEMNEIAGFVSRGVSRKRIIGMYLLEYMILSGAAFIPGLLAGYLLGKMAAGADDFLGFHILHSVVSTKAYRFTPDMVIVGIVAFIISTIIMMLPVAVKSRSTLVDHHDKRVKSSDIPFWEKYFIDVFLLVLSIYLLYNYKGQLDKLSEAVLGGEGIDPMIFADALLFLVAAGLIILRLIFCLVSFIYKITGRYLKPAAYAGMLQIMRTRKRSGIVSVFMVVTVAMSLFNANIARTINSNNEARLRLDLGSDYIIREHFEMKIKGQKPPQTWKYIEPDPALYTKLSGELGIDSFTRVIRDDELEARNASKVVKNATLMGINTKEFGLTANMKEDEGEEHWYKYLNDMAAKADGCIISKNLAEQLELKVGDTFTYSRIAPVDSVGIYASATGCVAAIVDVWPGYEKYSYTYNEEGKIVCEERYLVAANYATVVNVFGITPYEIWLKGDVAPDKVSGRLNEMLEEASRRLEDFESNQVNMEKMKGSALIQITNGLFTVDFLVALFLCVLGFMIHWISSIRDRELLFGIYRAMGISMMEIEKMLFLEQVFLTLVSVGSGVLSGVAATALFGELFAIVYLPQKHSVPLRNVTAVSDVIRLFIVIILAVIICMTIIRRIVKRLNITEALKLGED
ncbi:MAG: ABC transporter permease [Lachnospiraceae bacterium]|nr:ABC transporter permease [Lachnospiraceae bacterium]